MFWNTFFSRNVLCFYILLILEFSIQRKQIQKNSGVQTHWPQKICFHDCFYSDDCMLYWSGNFLLLSFYYYTLFSARCIFCFFLFLIKEASLHKKKTWSCRSFCSIFLKLPSNSFWSRLGIGVISVTIFCWCICACAVI